MYMVKFFYLCDFIKIIIQIQKVRNIKIKKIKQYFILMFCYFDLDFLFGSWFQYIFDLKKFIKYVEYVFVQLLLMELIGNMLRIIIIIVIIFNVFQ